MVVIWVYMVFNNPQRIEPTFLKVDSWSLGAGFITIKFNELRKGRKNMKFYAYKNNQILI